MRVLALFPGALGDFCLLAPSLAALTAVGARVELSLQRSLASVATRLLPGVTLGPPMDGAAMASLFAGEMAPALSRWLADADCVHAWLGRGAGAARLSARLAELGVVAQLHAVPRDDGLQHVGADYALAVGLDGLPAALRVLPTATSIVRSWRRSPRLLVHPGAGALNKRWDANGFEMVAAAWKNEGGDVGVLLGPAEEHEATIWRARGWDPHVSLSLAAAAELVASATHWVGNDSGMSHLAGVFDLQGVVLFGPTRPARWRPRADRLRPVEFGGRPVEVVAREVRAALGPFVGAT